MNNYFHKMFLNYDKCLDDLAKKLDTKIYKIDLNGYGLSNKDQIKLYNYLKPLLALNSDDDGTDSKFSLLTVLDMAFEDKKRLLAFLKKVKEKTNDEKLVSSLKNLINAIENVVESLDSHQETGVYEPSLPESVEYPYMGKEYSPVINKYYNYRTYAYNKSKDKDYFPGKEPTIDTSSFNGMSRNDLISMFSPEKFYNLNEDQVLALLQATVNEYLGSANVSTCAVVAKNLALNNNSVCMGQYDPNKGCIFINKKVIAKLGEAKIDNNSYYPYQLLSTIIHEATHRKQFSDLNAENKTEKQLAIAKDIQCIQSSLSTAQYLSLMDELDARNESLCYLREVAETLPSKEAEQIKEYYNLKKNQEKNNGKHEIPESNKKFFKDIYEIDKLKTSKPTLNNKSAQSFYRIIRGQYVPSEEEDITISLNKN